MAMKEDAPGAFLTDLKRTTQRLPTGSAIGNASEEPDGSPFNKLAHHRVKVPASLGFNPLR